MQQNAGPYPLAIFDLDGTLVDSFPWFLRVVNDSPATLISGRLRQAILPDFAVPAPATFSNTSNCRFGRFRASLRICDG